jgi:hypothetical protein
MWHGSNLSNIGSKGVINNLKERISYFGSRRK